MSRNTIFSVGTARAIRGFVDRRNPFWSLLMILSHDAFQFESEHGVLIELQLTEFFVDESCDFSDDRADARNSNAGSNPSDWDELAIYNCWKEQAKNRFGAGTPAPYIPRSQRQYEGDNLVDFCEVWIG
jgi:hypothetical protein